MTYWKGQQFYRHIGNIRSNAPTVYRTGAVTFGESACYANWPTYGHFIVDDEKLANKTAGKSGATRINAMKTYWNPYPYEIGVYKEYAEGDENVYWVRATPGISLVNIPGVNPVSVNGIGVKTTPTYGPANVATSIIYASETYRATNSWAEWDDLGIVNDSFFNPYLTTRIQLWVKYDPIKNATISNIYYLWRPDTKKFYAVPNQKTKIYDSPTSTKAIEQAKIISLVLQGDTKPQAEVKLTAPAVSGVAPVNSPGTTRNTAVTNRNGSSTTNASTATTPNAPIKATVRVRGNFGYINPGEPDGGAPQMVQYYRQGNSPLQEPDRHIFSPKPNEINYQNIGSEWTEIERVGRIPLVDWKNFRLMKISFQFLVIPDTTYRMGAYGESADDGITLSIDSKLDTLRNMATRPYPVILFGFDELLTNSSQFSNSAGSGVQFVIQDFSISSMMRTTTGAINRATCDVTLQEVPIEYINLITMPKLVPGQILAARNPTTETPFGGRETITENLPPVQPYETTKST